MTVFSDKLTHLLAGVQRPGRYTGNEFNSIRKDWDETELHFALAFPDTYEIGMSHLGMGILYHILNRESWIAAERVYSALGCPNGIQCWFEPEGGHRPYPAHRAAMQWLLKNLRPAGRTEAFLDSFSDINYGTWAEQHGIPFERLYGTPLHLRGATVVDMSVTPFESLDVLQPGEQGQPEFTIEGWLDRIDPP